MFKVVEQGSVKCLTKGHVYFVEDGKFVNDAGLILTIDKNLFEVSDLEDYLGINMKTTGIYRPPKVEVFICLNESHNVQKS